MSKPTTLKKEPFQKIRSKLERMAVLKQIPSQVERMTCKGDGDFTFTFTPLDFDEKEGLIGKISDNAGDLKNGEQIVANFQVGEDKYFMKTFLAIQASREILTFSEDLYLMQRRAYIRVDLSPKYKRGISVILQNNKAIFAAGECLDLSAGGARIVMTIDKLDIKANDILKMVFHVRGKWEFEATGLVKHARVNAEGVLEFGFEFDRTVRPLVSKLDLVMLELQKLTYIDSQS